MYVFDVEGVPGEEEMLTGMTSATSLSMSKVYVPAEHGGYRCARAALISVKEASVNMTLCGTTPTVTSGTNMGHTLNAGDSYVIRGETALQKVQFINGTAGNGAKVFVTYFY